VPSKVTGMSDPLLIASTEYVIHMNSKC